MTDTLTHAITIHQPLAWAIASGHCPIIPSVTGPGMEHEGKLIGIHAGISLDPGPGSVHALGVLASARIAEDELPRGALIGVARLVGVLRRVATNESGGYRFERMLGASVGEPIHVSVHERVKPWWRHPTRWQPGTKWGLLLAEAVLLPESIPMRGAGGVWRIPITPGTVSPSDVLVGAAWALAQWQKARTS